MAWSCTQLTHLHPASNRPVCKKVTGPYLDQATVSVGEPSRDAAAASTSKKGGTLALMREANRSREYGGTDGYGGTCSGTASTVRQRANVGATGANKTDS
jgi:hypothetical protein